MGLQQPQAPSTKLKPHGQTPASKAPQHHGHRPRKQESRMIEKNSFLGPAIVNAYDALSNAKYHIDCDSPLPLSCSTILGEITVAESQLATIIKDLIK